MRIAVTIGALAALAGCAPDILPAGPRRTSSPVLPDAGPPTWDGGTVVVAEDPPPPISGGTLALTEDGAIAVAADPDLDTISIVDLSRRTVRTIDVAPGDEPGRVALDGAGRAHVALRSAGEIADVDLATGSLIARRDVCPAPRGIAWDAATDELHVACADGALASLPAAGGAVSRRLSLGVDLRDVVVRGDVLWVTRFRRATLIRVARDGTVIDERALPSVSGEGRTLPVATPSDLEAEVAWRMIPIEGGVAISHQRATSGEFVPVVYYGTSGCGGSIVESAITVVRDDGTMETSPPIDVVLPVDLSIDEGRAWIAAPAEAYPRSGRSSTLLLDAAPRRDLARLALDVPPDGSGCAPAEWPVSALDRVGATVAVVARGTRVVTQTRAPAQIVISQLDVALGESVLPLASGRDAYDTGHMLFHARAGGALACASCHPEGGDDARTWRFSEFGPRRTQTMRGGLLETAPFHWAGDVETFDALVTEVFLSRMGGSVESLDEIPAFGRWMDTLPALPRPSPEDEAAVARGRALFEDPVVACATCHVGPQLTNGATVDVGTGEPLQVPTLLGLAYHAPYMHDGCAPTLHDRFGPCGGGDMHGHTSHLTPAQIDDLVAYLETL